MSKEKETNKSHCADTETSASISQSHPTFSEGGARAHLFQCESQLWTIETELKSIGALLQNIGHSASLGGEDLLGAGISIHRLAKRLHRVRDRLSSQVMKDPAQDPR